MQVTGEVPTFAVSATGRQIAVGASVGGGFNLVELTASGAITGNVLHITPYGPLWQIGFSANGLSLGAVVNER